MDKLERLYVERAAAQARRAELAALIQGFGRCHDKARWSRYQELLADMANAKAWLRRVNVKISAIQKERASPKVPKERKKPRPLSTGEALLRAARRMTRTLERLHAPGEHVGEFLPRLREFVARQEEHVTWRKREWEARNHE